MRGFFQSALLPFVHVHPPAVCDFLGNIASVSLNSWLELQQSTRHGYLGQIVSNCPALIEFLNQKASIHVPGVGIAKLDGGRVFADGVVVSGDGRALARDCAPDFRQPFEKHWLLNVPKLRRPKKISGRLLVVASHAADNYYHWLLEELPRLLLACESTQFDKILLTEKPFTDSVLQCLQIDVPRIPVTAISHYRADKLIVPSYLAPTGFPSPKMVELLKSFSLRYAPQDEQSRPEKIYISRRSAKRRTVNDETRLIAELQARGFHEVLLEKLSLQEQMRTFRAAKFVVAPHGAGLANLTFCQTGGKVIELFNNGYVHHCFAQLAGLVGMSYIGLCSDPNGPVGHGVGESQEEIRVPVEEILRWVDRESPCE
jgi:capsular polysaccharide biosynthesis protein